MGMNISSSGGYGPYMNFISTAPNSQVAQDATLGATAGTTGSAGTAGSSATAGNAGSAATSAALPNQDLFKLMTSLLTLMTQMLGLLNGSPAGNSPFQGALSKPSTDAGANNPAGSASAYPSGSPAATSPTLGSTPSGTGAADTGTGTQPATGGATSGSGYGGGNATPPSQDGSGNVPGNSGCHNHGGSKPAGGNTTPGTGGATTPGTVTPPTGSTPIVAADGSQPIKAFTASDYKNYLLAGSHGGQTGTAESILSTYADPKSRFAQTGNDQFQAAVAGMYANQFKADALGVPAAVTPGANIDKIASDLTQVQNVKMTPEAEMFSKVAALYRGNLTGPNLYDNSKLKTLLQSWGRNDIASQPFVGSQNGDVQSIGGVVKALNEEKDPAIRQAWLQQIFDFKGNTPSSPSGAVPNLPQYQKAIDLVRSGQFDQLLQGYVKTPGT